MGCEGHLEINYCAVRPSMLFECYIPIQKYYVVGNNSIMIFIFANFNKYYKAKVYNHSVG